MSQVYVSIGSNIQRVKNITAALDSLQAHFGELNISSVFESEAVGFDGDPFYNLVVGLQTNLAVAALYDTLRNIEFANGRSREGIKFSSRTLDIDILSYDDCQGVIDGVELPRQEIDYNAFVLRPLAEIAAEAAHPVSGIRYAQLWASFDQQCQKLWPIDFVWRDIKISTAVL